MKAFKDLKVGDHVYYFSNNLLKTCNITNINGTIITIYFVLRPFPLSSFPEVSFVCVVL